MQLIASAETVGVLLRWNIPVVLSPGIVSLFFDVVQRCFKINVIIDYWARFV